MPPEPTHLRVVGDIHGDSDALAAALETMTPDHHLVLLGDLVDRGPDSPGVLTRVCDLVQNGRATLIRSNHDDKLYRHLIGRPVTITPDLQETLDQLARHPQGGEIKAAFLHVYEQAPWWVNHDSITMVHGAFHPDMQHCATPAEAANRKARDILRWLSLYGESRQQEGEDLPTRTYGWVDNIPAGHVVMVGHDVQSTVAPAPMAGRLGGNAIFMDTGCGKGGKLSWKDV